MFQRPQGMLFPVQRAEKPWGHEILWAWSERYVGKILHVRRGESLSLQYHVHKDETISVLEGRVRVETGPSVDALESRDLAPGDCLRLLPGTIHRFEALVDADLLEVSTPELGDVVRLTDRYGRAGT